MEDHKVQESTNDGNKQPPENDSKVITAKSDDKVNTFSIVAALVNGIGVGLLLGLLLGLAVSPVVSGVIGTISSLLVVMLGLNDKYVGIVKSLRIGSFGIFAVAGILLGMYIRTHDALSPPMEDLKKEYIETGFNENQSLYFTALKYFDYVPVGWFGTTEQDTIAFSSKNKSVSSHLFSSTINVEQCALLKSADKDFPKSEIIYSYEAAGGIWKEMALNLKDLPDAIFIEALLAMRDAFCGLGQSGSIVINSSDKLTLLNEKDSLQTIKDRMKESGENWRIILENTETRIPNEYKKTLYLQLIKILTNEETN